MGVVHRDLKPENFGFRRPLLGDDDPSMIPPLKLFDFGLAQALQSPVTEETSRDLVTVAAAGTPFYMAPESWKHKCGASSDVWSAGVLVYLMLSLDLPYGISSCQSQGRTAVEQNSLEFPEHVWAQVSPDVRDLITGALEKDVKLRATTADVLASPWLTSPGRQPSLARCTTAPLGCKSCREGASMLLPAANWAAGATLPAAPLGGK